MAFYFGSGERFKENDADNPGPGHYDPKLVEGYKADPRSPFLGQERFAALNEEESGSEQALLSSSNQCKLSSPARNSPRSKRSEGSRQFSWTTIRINELQDETKTLKLALKNLQTQADKAERGYAAGIVKTDALIKQAESREHKLQIDLTATSERLQDRDLDLKLANEACTNLTSNLLETQNALATQEQEHAQVQQTLTARIVELEASAGNSHERDLAHSQQIARLAAVFQSRESDGMQSTGPSELADQDIIQSAITQYADLRSAHRDLSKQAEQQEKELQEAYEKLGSAQSTIESYESAKLALDNLLAETKEAAVDREATLQDMVSQMQEKLECLERKSQAELKALTAELSASQHRLQLESATCESLEKRLTASETERADAVAKLELQKIDTQSLKKHCDELDSDFANYRQAARTKYEQILASFQNENQLCAKMTADLTSSTAECQRLSTVLLNLQKMHSASVADSDATVHELQTQLNSMTSVQEETARNLHNSEEKAAQLARDKDSLTDELAQRTSRLDSAIAQQRVLEATLQRQAADLKEARSEISKLAELKANLSTDLAIAKEQASELETDLKGKLSALEVQHTDQSASYAALQQNHEDLATELSAAQAKLLTSEKELMVAQHEIGVLKMQTAKQTAELDSLSLQLAEKTSKLEETGLALESATSCKTRLLEDSLVLKAAKEDTMRELAQTQASVRELTRKLSDTTEEAKARNTRAGELNTELQKLQVQLQSEQATCAELSAKVLELTLKIGESQKALESASRGNAVLEETVLKLKQDAMLHESQRIDLEAESAGHLARANNVETECNKLLASNTQLLSQVEKLRSAKQECEAERDQLSETLFAAREQSQAQELSNHKLHLELKQAQSKEEHFETMLEANRQELANLVEKLKVAENSFEASNEGIKCLQKAHEEIQESLKTVEDRSLDLANKLHARDEELQQQELELEHLQKEVLDMTVIMKDKDLELLSLREEIDKHNDPRSPRAQQTETLRLSFDRLGESTVAELQAQNLELFECLQNAEVQCSEAEAVAEQKISQVAELQERLIDLEEATLLAQTEATEARRLADENTLLISQMRQMEVNVKELVDTHGLGHSNGKQRIQYHLRLKEELEELRHECMVLLKERFQLEQCIRYLAATSSLRTARVEADPRVTGRKQSILPSSLRQLHTWATPTKRAALLQAGRGLSARSNNQGTPTKEELLSSIKNTVERTSNSVQGLSKTVRIAVDATSTPRRDVSSCGSLSSEGQDCGASTSEGAPLGVEAAILARVAAICNPERSGRASALLKHRAVQMSDSSAGENKENLSGNGRPHTVENVASKWKI